MISEWVPDRLARHTLLLISIVVAVAPILTSGAVRRPSPKAGDSGLGLRPPGQGSEGAHLARATNREAEPAIWHA
jgi:hypothetical protein